MPASLLDSQLATLEPLGDDEPGVRVSGAGEPGEVTDALLAALDDHRRATGALSEESPS
jgi:gluconokinase